MNHQTPGQPFSISQADLVLLVQELVLKLEQTPVGGELQPDYQALMNALQSLHGTGETTPISKFQWELLRNVVVSGSLQSTSLADAIAAADEQLTDDMNLMVRVA